MAKKLSKKSQQISQGNNTKYGIKPITETVFIKNDDPKEAREALKNQKAKQAEATKNAEAQRKADEAEGKADGNNEGNNQNNQGAGDTAVAEANKGQILSSDQQDKAKKVADLIFQVKNLQDIHTNAEDIKSSSCTKEGLQNIQNILFKTSGLNVFGDADSDSGKKSPLLSSEYAEIQLCDFDSEDDKAVKTKCFPGGLQSGTMGISKFMNELDCARAYTFFNDSHDDPTLLGGIKIMAKAFYAKAGELSEDNIPQQINKFCSIEGMVNTPAGPELCNSFNMDSLSDFISQ